MKSTATDTVKIGLVGKYVELQDAYKSIDESLLQAAIYNHHKLDLHLFHSEKLNNENAAEQLKDMDGILIAPDSGREVSRASLPLSNTLVSMMSLAWASAWVCSAW